MLPISHHFLIAPAALELTGSRLRRNPAIRPPITHGCFDRSVGDRTQPRRCGGSCDSASAGALELLAPAGDRLCVTAAVENGADAVYFGLECGFNARARATNLHLDALPEVMSFLHERGVRGYVTLNTLVFPSELETVEQHIVRLTEAGVDAVLVQDLGLVRLLRAVSPDLAVHASTQMTLTSGECIRAAEELGIERVVLARELSIDEIRTIRSQTAVELEVFVHGALCVAYSGQCLTSESLGGRSANRGQCAQACRLPYDLVCDGQDVDLGDVKYLLSPQDLAAYALVPELIDAGVSSFKIEGRLKTPEYVANITRHYRRALDAAAAGREADFTEQDVTEMELSFSRGFSPGWLGGCDHKMLVPGLSSAKRGVLVGEVKAVRGRSVVVAARRPVAPGDGVVFAGNREEGDEQGGRVYAVTPRGGGDIELAFGHGAIDFAQLAARSATLEDRRPAAHGEAAKVVHGREAAAASGAGSRRACRGRRDAANYRPGRQRRELRRGISGTACRGEQASAHPAKFSNNNWAGSAARFTNCGIFALKLSASRWCRSACSASCGTR